MGGERFTQEQVDRMVELYEAGASIQGVADQVGTSRETVRVKLRTAGVLEDRRARTFAADELDGIQASYEAGASLRSLGKQFAIHGDVIAGHLRRRGVAIRGAGGPPKVTPGALARMTAAYTAGKSCREIGRDEGIHYITVGKKLRDAGVLIEAAGRRRKREFTEVEKERMRELAELGVPVARIAREIGAGQVLVGRVLRAMGAGGRRWKGGRTLHEGGYVMVGVAPDDPMATMRNRAGYVLEHRLVMARSLGRPLTRHETVHHSNGVRDQNGIENLELRRGSHGKHQAYRCKACGSLDVEPLTVA